MGTSLHLSCRDRAILRAVAGGGAELLAGAEPDLFLDGRCCADQLAAHRLARAGLIVAAGPSTPGSRVAAQLTTVGRAALTRTRRRPGDDSPIRSPATISLRIS